MHHPAPVKGLFFKHRHLDHIMGVPDFAVDTPIYVGPQESTHTSFQNLFVRGATDDFFAGPRLLSAIDFGGPSNPAAPAVIDFFGD